MPSYANNAAVDIIKQSDTLYLEAATKAKRKKVKPLKVEPRFPTSISLTLTQHYHAPPRHFYGSPRRYSYEHEEITSKRNPRRRAHATLSSGSSFAPEPLTFASIDSAKIYCLVDSHEISEAERKSSSELRRDRVVNELLERWTTVKVDF